MATLTNNEIARAIYLSTKDAKDLPLRFEEVTQFLAKKRLLGRSKEILSSLQAIINKEEGVVVVKVGSARVISEGAKVHIAGELKKRYGAKKIIFEEYIDERLIGGMRIEANNEVIDLSIKNKINKLQTYLTRSI